MDDHQRIERSLALYHRAQACIPGVAQLISRRPTRAALGVSPIYAERAKGCRIWDVDGNEYIDWHSGVGPIVLGYCDDEVDAAGGGAPIPPPPPHTQNKKPPRVCGEFFCG